MEATYNIKVESDGTTLGTKVWDLESGTQLHPVRLLIDLDSSKGVVTAEMYFYAGKDGQKIKTSARVQEISLQNVVAWE